MLGPGIGGRVPVEDDSVFVVVEGAVTLVEWSLGRDN